MIEKKSKVKKRKSAEFCRVNRFLTVPGMAKSRILVLDRNKKIEARAGFTLVEVVAALVILSMLIASVMVTMSNITASMMDLKLQSQAYNIARENMEKLLASNSVQDTSEYSYDEMNPDLDWQTVVEPFYEPISNKMWIRGVCTSGYTDSKGQRQTIELTCWLTGLSAQQVRQILDQEKRTREFMKKYSETDFARQQEAQREITVEYLEQQGLDFQAYKDFLERQDRRRMDYIAQSGFNDGYYELLDQMSTEEGEFLYRLGVKYDDYVAFYNRNTDRGESGEDIADPGNRDKAESGVSAGDKEVKDSAGDKNDTPEQDKKTRPVRNEQLYQKMKELGWSDETIKSFLSK